MILAKYEVIPTSLPMGRKNWGGQDESRELRSTDYYVQNKINNKNCFVITVNRI